jgi:hypothetical protein
MPGKRRRVSASHDDEAIAFVFTNVLVLVGVWLANNMMVHA